MEEGNLYRRRKRGPDGEGGGSDPAGSGGRLAMLFRLGVGRAKSKFYDHSLCWHGCSFFYEYLMHCFIPARHGPEMEGKPVSRPYKIGVEG